MTLGKLVDLFLKSVNVGMKKLIMMMVSNRFDCKGSSYIGTEVAVPARLLPRLLHSTRPLG